MTAYPIYAAVASLLGTGVELIEALTIVLAVGYQRDGRVHLGEHLQP